MRTLLSFVLLFSFISAKSQNTDEGITVNPYNGAFELAYNQHPEIPKGLLEAVAWTTTRFHHLDQNTEESCIGYPKAYTVMGLTYDGKSYFRENLKKVAALSGYSVQEIMLSPEKSVAAYAKAYAKLMKQKKTKLNLIDKGNFNAQLHERVLQDLSEIPDSGAVNAYARDAQIYQIFVFLNDEQKAAAYQFDAFQIDLEKHFGENYKVLSSAKVIFDEEGISTPNGERYAPRTYETRSAEYGPAIWNPAPSCNYSSRNGVAVSAITIHTIQGSYAGAISWAQNCNSNVSYHYVIRSSDGQITQMVAEANKAWHVGSENPYTIGYEHEGYVSQTGWYTTALYNASADLSRDICNSGYGISPLRTYFGAASTGTNTLGGCTRIKGHQHYPNQSHTDPGINWDWERYYRLINNAPAQNNLTAASGTFYDSGGATGNYADDQRYITTISPAGASSLTLTFSSFSLENNWDFLYIYNGNSINAPLIGVYTGNNSPGTVTSSGGSLTFEFRSDCATVQSGWAASWTSNATPPPPTDHVAPTTSVSTPGSWITADFTANYSDQDNSGGSGIEKSYYQVIDFDGIEWRANSTRGFFSDNFDLGTLHSDWFTAVGTWDAVNGVLQQSDEAEGNTNMYAFLEQSLSNRYLYHWSAKMEGSGTNRRAGFHYFSDDGSLPNRGNSYFVWFRLDNDKVQLYEVINDVFTLMDEVTFDFNAAQWYDFKVIYDRITGKHSVYIDNSLVQSYTDNTPLATGAYISYRSGNCIYTCNNLKVYRSRAASTTVTVGPTGDLRYQNQDPLTPAGRVKSIVADYSGNLSAISWQDVNVDWTIPSAVSTVNDGPAADIGFTTNANELEANWSSSFDQHSDVARYWYAIGTTPGGTDVRNWTDNYWYDTVRASALNLNYGSTYYFSVRAENGAGLLSPSVFSNGQTLQTPSLPPVASFSEGNTFICAGDSIAFQNSSQDASSYSWNFQNGNPASSTAQHPQVQFSTSGTYQVQLIANGPGGADTLIQHISVDVSQPITASFAATDTLVYLPNAFVGFTNLSSQANGYSWDFGDGGSSNGINPWHIYSQAGIFEVFLSAHNNACPSDTFSRFIHVLDPNSIQDLNESTFNCHYNGEAIVIRMNTPTPGMLMFRLYEMSGKLIAEKSLNAITGENSLFFHQLLPAGVYLIEMRSTDQISRKKVVIHQ